MALETTLWDPVKRLHDDQDMAEYLEAALELALEDGDSAIIAAVLGDIARAKDGMSAIARETGLSRESLYKALSGESDPKLSTVIKVVKALGLTLHATKA